MTKEQKTASVLATVIEARHNGFDRTEFVGMLNFIWDGLEGATGVARDPQQSLSFQVTNAGDPQ